MHITPDTKLSDIFPLPEFLPMRGQFISSNTDWFSGGKEQMSLLQLGELQKTWSVSDMITGINRLRQIAQKQKPYVYPLVPDHPSRLICKPAEKKTNETICLLLAGGAYGAVCSLAESIPAAAKLNDLGMDCYCLNYRTATPDSMVHGLMPQPLEDIALSLKFIRNHFHLPSYWMAGFSAGGHACALWGTKHVGARAYSLPQPNALLLAYPLISLLNLPSGPVRDFMMQGLFGTGHNHDLAQKYSAHLHVDTGYPPVFLIKARDDDTVPSKDADEMEEALRNAVIPYRFDIVPSGGHGFGLGSETSAAGWIERAASWVNGRDTGEK